MKLSFDYIDTKKVKIDRTLIKGLVASVFKDELKIPGNINFVFGSDDYIHQINVNYLKHDYFTDVITFSEEVKNIVNGNIFISLDRVKDNAVKYSEGLFYKELYRIVLHAILHLIGYNDNTAHARSIMTNKENYYLNNLSLHF